jgi:NitT/TauT family transport system permease protein
MSEEKKPPIDVPARPGAAEGLGAGRIPQRLPEPRAGGPRPAGPGFFRGFFKIRDEPGPLGQAVMALLCIGLIGLLWWIATRGATAEERLVSPAILGSPAEVFGSFKALWFEKALTRNTGASLWRVIQGYGLALAIGIPLGVLAGCFRRIGAFLAPLTIFGTNVPVVALVPLTVLWFGSDEQQKVMFIFIACVAFVIVDATRTIRDVDDKYLDTAYTLGASRAQVIFKVLVPLALPDLFNSMRLLFGLAFGYIIVAEMVNQTSGLGALILSAQRIGPRSHVYLILLVIALVAYVLDRLLYWVGTLLFPYRFRD